MLLMGKSTISMAIFNSKLLVYQRVHWTDILLTPSLLVEFHYVGLHGKPSLAAHPLSLGAAGHPRS